MQLNANEPDFWWYAFVALTRSVGKFLKPEAQNIPFFSLLKTL